MQIRKQLTLFVPKKDSETIELVRAKFNHAQKELIDAHVTLCREDEIENLKEVLDNLNKIKNFEIKIRFDKPEITPDGKGIFLTAKNTSIFDELRSRIIANPRKQIPHITLVHPRNSEFSEEVFKQINNFEFPKEIDFKTISLIEQPDDGKWKILKEFKF